LPLYISHSHRGFSPVENDYPQRLLNRFNGFPDTVQVVAPK